jgi:hypothetical protein
MKAVKIKPVNVLITDAILSRLDARSGASRSQKARRVLAAIIAAFDDGVDPPYLETLSLSRSSTPSARKRRGIDEKDWRKAIFWIPETMHLRIEELCSAERLRVADFIRGAMIMATDQGHVLESDPGDLRETKGAQDET